MDIKTGVLGRLYCFLAFGTVEIDHTPNWCINELQKSDYDQLESLCKNIEVIYVYQMGPLSILYWINVSVFLPT